MDRRLLGIVTIVLLLSFAGVFSVAMFRRQPDVLVLLQNDYPEKLINIERGGRYFTFAHGFVTRRDLAELEIRFSVLTSSPEPTLVREEVGHDFANYAEIDLVRSYIGAENLIADECLTEVDGEPESKIRLFDLSRSILPFSSTECAGLLSSVFGQIMRRENTSFLRGVSDFFYDRGGNVEYLVIAHGTKETTYSAASASSRPLEEAPEGGVVVLDDLKKGDVVMVQFTVVPDKERMPERCWNKNYDRTIYEVIRVYADGVLVFATANQIEVDLT